MRRRLLVGGMALLGGLGVLVFSFNSSKSISLSKTRSTYPSGLSFDQIFETFGDGRSCLNLISRNKGFYRRVFYEDYPGTPYCVDRVTILEFSLSDRSFHYNVLDREKYYNSYPDFFTSGDFLIKKRQNSK